MVRVYDWGKIGREKICGWLATMRFLGAGPQSAALCDSTLARHQTWTSIVCTGACSGAHRALAVEPLARLLRVHQLHRLAQDQLPPVRLLQAHEHAEQRGLAAAVAADDACLGFRVSQLSTKTTPLVGSQLRRAQTQLRRLSRCNSASKVGGGWNMPMPPNP